MFQYYDLLYPTLHFLHLYPDILPRIYSNQGAVKNLLRGAELMCPGIILQDGVYIPSKTVVAIYIEGKEHALGVGHTLMTSDEIKSINKGPGVSILHFLGDGLYLHAATLSDTK